MTNLLYLKNDLISPLLARLSSLLPALLLSTLLVPAALSQPAPSIEMRLSELESREQIRRVMKQYGRFLDIADFDAFASLFAEADGVYISGGVSTKGAEAIGQVLSNIFSANPSGLKEPRFHVFFNEVIEFNSSIEATAFSQSAYIAPGKSSNAPEMVFFASYEDTFIIEDGQWKFKQRIVLGDIPARVSQ